MTSALRKTEHGRAGVKRLDHSFITRFVPRQKPGIVLNTINGERAHTAGHVSEDRDTEEGRLDQHPNRPTRQPERQQRVHQHVGVIHH